MKTTNLNIIPAVDKAAGMLECLGGSISGMSQAELCRSLNITQSTCYRIIQTLLEHKWICRCGGNRYDIAPGLLPVTEKLTDATRRFRHLQPQLEILSTRTGLSCKLSIRQGQDQVTILRAESPRPMAVSGRVGTHFPLIEGSVGAALLCGTERKDILSLAEACREDIAESSDPQIILKRIENLQQDGFCLNSKRNRWNVNAMSTTLSDASGHVSAALTLLGFADEFEPEKLAGLKNALQETAAQCTRLLGE